MRADEVQRGLHAEHVVATSVSSILNMVIFNTIWSFPKAWAGHEASGSASRALLRLRAR